MKITCRKEINININGFCSTELFCGNTKRNNILQKSAELSKSLLRNSAGVFGSAEFFCGTLYYKSILRNFAEAISEVQQNSVEFCRLITVLLRFVVPQNSSVEQKLFCGIPQKSAEFRDFRRNDLQNSAEQVQNSAWFRRTRKNNHF